MIVSWATAGPTSGAVVFGQIWLGIGQMQSTRLVIHFLERILRIHVRRWRYATNQAMSLTDRAAMIGREASTLPARLGSSVVTLVT